MLADIMKAALKYADRPAFVIEDETYTYSRLVGQAISISHTLRNLLNRHHCRVRILISPDYNQKVLHPKDKEILCKLFGEANVFDFSGINEYTNDYHYYYEQGHYRPLLGKKLMERIYGHSL